MRGVPGRLFTLLPISLLPLLSASCGSGTEPPPPPRATKLVLVGVPSAVAETMVPLSTQPVIQAADASGTSVATTTTVTAEVVSGHGAVMAGGSATTDASGRAVFSELTLGAVWGQVSTVVLRFTSPGLDPVQREVQLRCPAAVPLTIGQTVNRTLTSGDCTFGDTAVRNPSFRNIFEITTSQPVTAVQLTSNLSLVAKGPNELDHYFGWAAFADLLSFKVLLSKGPNRIAVTAVVMGDPLGGGGSIRTGPYSLTAADTTEDLSCEAVDAVATTPITSSQKLGAGDCVSGSILEDRLMVGVPPNGTMTASMTTTAFQPRLRLMDPQTEAILADETATGTATVTLANGSTARGYRLLLSSQASGSSGAYTLSVKITYPSPGATTDPSAVLSPLTLYRNPTRRLE